MPGINKGGTQEIDGVRFTLTNAFHSSSSDSGEYLGESCGIVIRFDGKSIYFAGDTCVFGDMQLIARLYKPDVAVLPIGDWFTMGPEEAALALELLGNPRCVPSHWGTFGLLTGHPGRAREAHRRNGRADRARGIDRAVRERWFGATGRRVPEIALEDELELGDALVLDALDEGARSRMRIDAAGRSSCVRARRRR